MGEVPDIDTFESAQNIDAEVSEGEIEMLEMDDDLSETKETNPEEEILLQ